ncbi:hypothetical protein HA402_016226 [Bradysia odoriphaga]|nr:hypothetical protein HA402_016226 [Bradysia odoriphaga]
MLKKTLICKHNIDLSQYCQLRAFLKTNADGYQSVKSKVFTPADLHKIFVNVVYLGMKVVMIFGVVGACRGIELTNFTTENVKDDGTEIEVFLPTTKNKEKKYYVICDEFAQIIRSYMKLRSPNTTNNRFSYNFATQNA